MSEIKTPSGFRAFWRDNGKQITGALVIAVVCISVWLSYRLVGNGPPTEMIDDPVPATVEPEEEQPPADFVLPTGD